MAWTFTVLGGGQEIGANSYLLSLSGVPLLLDADSILKNSEWIACLTMTGSNGSWRQSS